MNTHSVKETLKTTSDGLPKNIPYVKKYDNEGNVVNKHRFYPSPFPNRKMRRFKNEEKSHGKMRLIYLGKGKFVKYISNLQHISAGVDKDGHFLPSRSVQHYLEITPKIS